MDMERDASRQNFQARQNQQRFAQHQYSQEQSHQNMQTRQQQQQHFTQQQQIQTEQREAQQIDADINSVNENIANGNITSEEGRTLLWKLENKKRGLQTAGGPPPDTPWYVGTDKDIGKTWWEDTDADKPGGGKWRIQYTMEMRGSGPKAVVLIDERKNWEDLDNARRDQSRADAAESRAHAADGRAQHATDLSNKNEQRKYDIESDRQVNETRKTEADIRAIDAGKVEAKTKSDTILREKLEKRADRDADAALRDEWTQLKQSQAWIDAGGSSMRKEQVANENGFDETGSPTTSKRAQKVNELLDKYLKAEAPDLVSSEPQIPFNGQTGMYEVVV